MTIPMMALLVLVASEGPANPKPINPIPADHAQRFEEGTKLFKSNVGAILKNRCLNCHGGEKTRGGFSLIDRKAMLVGGDSGVFHDTGWLTCVDVGSRRAWQANNKGQSRLGEWIESNR